MKKNIVAASSVLVGLCVARAADEETNKAVYGAMRTYPQTLKIKVNGEAAVVPRFATVYDGRKWALSTRWDDSNSNALNIRRKMLQNGIRGTFYLNSKHPEKPEGSLARRLAAEDICSVGGHSVSHPRLPKLTAGDSFYELMANRVALEYLTDRPVNSLAFPYGGYRDKNRPEVLEGVSEAFLRTGYHHCVYSHFVTHNEHLPEGLVSTGLQVVPGDRQVNADKFWGHMAKIRRDAPGYREKSSCIFLGVHPWQKGEELERLSDVMGKLQEWTDFWHCTQTEYAAFERQRRSSAVKQTAEDAYRLTRPCGFELGNDIPLTLDFGAADVAAAEVDGVACTVHKVNGATYVNVPHGPRFGAPVCIDQAAEGASAKFAGLRSSLTLDNAKGTLSYALTNEAGEALKDVNLTVSLPPVFRTGMVRLERDAVAKADEWRLDLPLPAKREGDYWTQGRRYFVAQLDFARNGRRGRLFTELTVPGE